MTCEPFSAGIGYIASSGVRAVGCQVSCGELPLLLARRLLRESINKWLGVCASVESYIYIYINITSYVFLAYHIMFGVCPQYDHLPASVFGP